jgi:hypothetical protein
LTAQLLQLADGDSSSPVVTFGLPLLAVALSPLTSLITFRVVKRRELAEERRNDVLREGELAAAKRADDLEERIRTETLRWAGPILSAVDDLRSRLRNILQQAGHVALDPEWQPRADWSVTYEYFLDTTLYLSAVYFGYVELLRQSLSLEFFRSQQEKDQLFEALFKVSSTLSSYPPPWPSKGVDRQVFYLEQRAIGQLVALWDTDSPRCLTYPEFTARLADPVFSAHIEPLRRLLDGVAPGVDARWIRLKHTGEALDELAEFCKRLMTLGRGPSPSGSVVN